MTGAVVAQSVLSVRMDEKTKRDFALFCEQVGMSVSTAINIFMRQTLREGRIPFSVSVVPGVQPEAADPTMAVPTRDAIVQAVCAAAEPFPAIERVILFGSYARGEARPGSDIDLRVIRDENTPFSMMNLAAFSKAIRLRTGKEVDVLSKRDIGDAALCEAIQREGVAVYERKE